MSAFVNGGWDFEALQVVTPDKNGLFPWEMGFDLMWMEFQDLLDEKNYAAD